MQVLEAYRSADDVFCDDFLNGVIFTGVTNGHISQAARKLLESLGNSWIETIDTGGADDIPPPGPYVTAEQHLLEVFRLYNDGQGAFMHGLIPASHL